MSRSSARHAPPHDDRRHTALVQDMSRLVRRALLDAIVELGDASRDCAALTVEPARVPIAPAHLAASHPGGPQSRHEARALYERCLAHYRHVVRASQADSSLDDVGAAVACFVAANLQALHGIDATPEMLLRLERQLGGVATLSSAWASASARERQLYFEQMAILAVLIRETSAHAVLQGPAAVENVRRAARRYLRQLLGLDPDQLTLDAGGLSLREA
ncbi:DUF6683 family protein [Piscinibacter sp. XHJ-5]|uniref:DUF6683 family protein n=1 Tax=Piscinibacter sp. XHJ-5 TaxID=3037797 RepID=UPI002452C3E1|nr:DUF6683 family protein [Piscinibacter sp. XHJ-5]